MNKVPRSWSKKNDEVLEFDRTLPELDECHYLIQKMIEQAVRDFISLEKSTVLAEQFDYQTACGFLFDDSYRVQWGEEEKSLQDLLDCINLDIEWMRKKAIEAKEKKLKKIRLKQAQTRKKLNAKNRLSLRTNGVRSQ